MTQFNQNDRNLIKRYLIWCYKTTKAELDRIDRKFTQLTVDQSILAQLVAKEKKLSSSIKKDLQKKIEDFRIYMKKKEEESLTQKFLDPSSKILTAEYEYLKLRLNAIEASIRQFLGVQVLQKIKFLYEEEMTRRIWESREH